MTALESTRPDGGATAHQAEAPRSLVSQAWRPGLASAAVLAGGIVVAEAALEAREWTWVAIAGLGLLAGSIAASPRLVWLVPAGLLAGEAVASTLGLLGPLGPYWYLILAGRAVLAAAAFVAGSAIGWHRRSLARPWRRALVATIVVSVVGLSLYIGIVGWVYSAEYVVQAGATDCRTPGSAEGWTYDAVNYDPTDDARLLAANPDPTDCSSQGTTAGSAVVSADGTPLAGWYIPAADASVGPSGPTLVLVHGGKSNKSGMLKYATPFHQAYNLLVVDLRNSGRSGGTVSTGGLQERFDVRAMIDWLERTKHPSWVAIVGNSNGAAAGLAEAVDDVRVRALVLDSMHASIVAQLGNVAETEEHLPAWPGALAVIAGVSIRVGGDLTSVDPIRMLPLVGDRPVLLLHGSEDEVDRPPDSLDRNVVAGLGAGVNLTLHVCQGAKHGEVIDTCPTAWAAWATSFLAEARGS